MIEMKFIFYNIFQLLTNIMVVFYGFAIGANQVAKEIPADKKNHFNFFVNIQ